MAETKKKTTAKKSTAKKGAAATNKKPVATKKAPAKNAAKKTAAANKTTKTVANKKAATKKSVAKKPTNNKVESKKHVSDTAKATPKDNWKNIAIAAGAIALVLILVIGFIWVFSSDEENNTGNENMTDSTGNDVSSDSIELLIVEDPNCVSCQVDVFASQVKSNLIPELEVKKVSFDSEEGKTIVNELELLQVPAYIFSNSIAQRDDWETQLAGAFIEVTINGETQYMLNPQFIPSKVMIEMPQITDTAIVVGNPDAKVTIYEFSDYECPFCAIAEGNEELVTQFQAQNPSYVPPMPKVFEEYIDTGKVKLVFYNMPLESLHPTVRPVHLAALCANEQDMWEEFHHKLFTDRSDWVSESDKVAKMKEYATEFGLDETQFNECLDSKKYDSQIEEELALGVSYGVSGTPAFFINKNFLSGAQDYETFKSLIDAELAME